MNPHKKTVAVKAMEADENISELCNRYYHNLKNKETVARLFFHERVSIAHEIITEAQENEVYFYRRTIDDISSSDETSGENISHAAPVNLASNDYLGFT